MSEPDGHGPERWVTKRELATHLGVCEKTIENWHHDGLPHRRFGRRLVRYRISEVEAWLDRGEEPRSKEAA